VSVAHIVLRCHGVGYFVIRDGSPPFPNQFD
jgi:hypothetical protein